MKTFTFIDLRSIDPENIEKSTPRTIELTAEQVINHRRRNTSIWRNFVPVDEIGDNELKKVEEVKKIEPVIEDPLPEGVEELEPEPLETFVDPTNEDILKSDYDPFVKKGKRGRKPKNK